VQVVDYSGKEDAVIYIVIMAGGKGERFWPRSTRSKPKQFHRIASSRTMIQETFYRVFPEHDKEKIFFVLGTHLTQSLLDDLPVIDRRNLIVEPVGRNTAPAIGLAAVHVDSLDHEATMVVLTADHLVRPRDEFLRAVRAAGEVAATGRLVTFGIKPVRPATEYGYIEIGGKREESSGLAVYDVKQFTEKPEEKKARLFVESGRYLWNSGMFAFRVREILGAIQQHMPGLYGSLMRIQESLGSGNEARVTEEEFGTLKSVSIDYGVMEKSSRIACIEPDFLWDDIGSWSALERYREKDEQGNVSEGDVVLFDSRDNIVLGDDRAVISLVGVNNLIVVKEKNRVLVCHRDHDQQIKEALKLMAGDDTLSGYL
jgi:mannose-1-phosphate guanylyltransferase